MNGGPMTREEMEDTIAAVLCDYHPNGPRVENDVTVLMRAMDAGIAHALRECANYLDSLPPGGEALRGPYWYRQGVHDGANELRDVADDIADGQQPHRYAPTAKALDGVRAQAQDYRKAQAAAIADAITRAGASPEDVQHLIAAIADQTRDERHERRLREPSLRTCVTPTCLRQFDMNARMSGREPERPTWSGDGWRLMRGSAAHSAGGYICPDHADLLVAHMPRRIEPYTPGRIDIRCTCEQWSTVGMGLTWHGAARGLWEQHLLREMGTIA